MRRLALVAVLALLALTGCGVAGRAWVPSGIEGLETGCTDAGDRVYVPSESWRGMQVVQGGCRP